LVLRTWTSLNATLSPVVADAIRSVVIDDVVIVNIPHIADIVYGPVVVEAAILPAAAVITLAEVAVPIRNAAVETNHRAPIAFMKKIPIAIPAPVAGRP
jgi:hypothetical protein